MSLRDQALLDVQGILEGPGGFSEEIDLIEPDGTVNPMTGFTGDITAMIEPDSGAIVKGRRVHVMLFTKSLPAGARPIARPKLTDNSWRVSFKRITTAVATTYAVVAVTPDDSMGTISLELANHKPL